MKVFTLNNAKELGQLIRERRTAKGLDQASLANIIGSSRKWVTEIENGKPRAQVVLVLKVFKALDISITYSDKPAQASEDTLDLNKYLSQFKK